MASLKLIIKHILGKIRCMVNKVHYPGEVYIGKNVHITNGRNIKMGKNVSVRPDCDLFAGKCIIIGDGCDIGTRNRIDGHVTIERNVLFGPDNYICSEDHCYEDIDVPIMNQGAYSPKKNGHSELKIGEGSWIGTHVAIIGDVHIGKHCVIGANSVVTRDIPDNCVAVGNPAKIVKKYDMATHDWMVIK